MDASTRWGAACGLEGAGREVLLSPCSEAGSGLTPSMLIWTLSSSTSISPTLLACLLPLLLPAVAIGAWWRRAVNVRMLVLLPRLA